MNLDLKKLADENGLDYYTLHDIYYHFFKESKRIFAEEPWETIHITGLGKFGPDSYRIVRILKRAIHAAKKNPSKKNVRKVTGLWKVYRKLKDGGRF